MVGVARRTRRDEVVAGARREHLSGRDADAELRGDLLGALAVELPCEQRGALAHRQAGKVVDEPAEGLAAPQHGRGVLAVVAGGGRLVVERLVAPARAADLVDRAVAGEPVQPRAQLVRAVAGAQCVVGADEDVLDDVLGIVFGAAEQGAGIADECAAMAGVERREGGTVAGRDAASEVGVIRTRALEECGHGGHDANAAAPEVDPARRAARASGRARRSGR
ncbi:MAG: hypothetical protein QOD24_3024 [Solirubrobacteraceae bacterium]|nr:hypothetical protein [Solirubrobacteraceae bacterium]